MGYPIFPGEDETDQLSLMMEVLGIPGSDILANSQRKTKFFNDQNLPIFFQNSNNKVRKPGTKVLEDVLEINDDPSFVNFIEVRIWMYNIVLALFGMGSETADDS